MPIQRKQIQKLLAAYEAEIVYLEEREEDLLRRIELLENLIPTVLVWYMWKTSQVNKPRPFSQLVSEEEAKNKLHHLQTVLDELHAADATLKEEEAVMRKKIGELEESLRGASYPIIIEPSVFEFLAATVESPVTEPSKVEKQGVKFEDLLENVDTDWKKKCESLIDDVNNLNESLEVVNEKLKKREEYIKHLEGDYKKKGGAIEEKIQDLEEQAQNMFTELMYKEDEGEGAGIKVSEAVQEALKEVKTLKEQLVRGKLGNEELSVDEIPKDLPLEEENVLLKQILRNKNNTIKSLKEDIKMFKKKINQTSSVISTAEDIIDIQVLGILELELNDNDRYSEKLTEVHHQTLKKSFLEQLSEAGLAKDFPIHTIAEDDEEEVEEDSPVFKIDKFKTPPLLLSPEEVVMPGARVSSPKPSILPPMIFQPIETSEPPSGPADLTLQPESIKLDEIKEATLIHEITKTDKPEESKTLPPILKVKSKSGDIEEMYRASEDLLLPQIQDIETSQRVTFEIEPRVTKKPSLTSPPLLFGFQESSDALETPVKVVTDVLEPPAVFSTDIPITESDKSPDIATKPEVLKLEEPYDLKPTKMSPSDVPIVLSDDLKASSPEIAAAPLKPDQLNDLKSIEGSSTDVPIKVSAKLELSSLEVVTKVLKPEELYGLKPPDVSSPDVPVTAPAEPEVSSLHIATEPEVLKAEELYALKPQEVSLTDALITVSAEPEESSIEIAIKPEPLKPEELHAIKPIELASTDVPIAVSAEPEASSSEVVTKAEVLKPEELYGLKPPDVFSPDVPVTAPAEPEVSSLHIATEPEVLKAEELYSLKPFEVSSTYVPITGLDEPVSTSEIAFRSEILEPEVLYTSKPLEVSSTDVPTTILAEPEISVPEIATKPEILKPSEELPDVPIAVSDEPVPSLEIITKPKVLKPEVYDLKPFEVSSTDVPTTVLSEPAISSPDISTKPEILKPSEESSQDVPIAVTAESVVSSPEIATDYKILKDSISPIKEEAPSRLDLDKDSAAILAPTTSKTAGDATEAQAIRSEPLDILQPEKVLPLKTPSGLALEHGKGMVKKPSIDSLTTQTLQSKCRVKDHLIRSMADQLRELARNNVWSGNKLLASISTDPVKTYDFDRNTLFKYLKGEEPKNFTPLMKSNAEYSTSNPLNIKVVRKLDKNSLLIEWSPPPSDQVVGFQIFINGEFMYWVHSAKRNMALLHPLDLSIKLDITVSPVDLNGDIVHRSSIMHSP